MLLVARYLTVSLGLLFGLFAGAVHAEALPLAELSRDLTPVFECLSGRMDAFELRADVTAKIDGKPQRIEIRLKRLGDERFEFAATHADYSLILQRSETFTRLALPHHRVLFQADGEPDVVDHLAAERLLDRLVSADSAWVTFLPILKSGDAAKLIPLLTAFVDTRYDAASRTWTFDKKVTARFSENGANAEIKGKDYSVALSIERALDADQRNLTVDADFQLKVLNRAELERTFVRGMRRATEILAPGSGLTKPAQQARVDANGELRWIDGHRVCILRGTPEEIGRAHGRMLKREAMKTIDSVLHTFGLVNTIRSGRWFRHELDDAYARLSPHIPEDHKRETAALATALEIDNDIAQSVNVFPELFHCSGFAVFDSATNDGTLYHGRVLDYMTSIGLQDSATTFIVAVDGKIPFANVGYAGFVGSVTGMNAEAISLGEMGGRGEGEWDGAPMATLMRRALEECATLEQVKNLWSTSPRTCEYYYVFADGKTNAAVGVAATPEKVEFIEPSESHELLGPGIPDAVVLSAGSRLKTLRARVLDKHGTIDEETAIWLMSRPVAMGSNLHNALFVPAEGVLYVANADHEHPAAERPYVRLDLRELLRSTIEPQSVSERR